MAKQDILETGGLNRKWWEDGDGTSGQPRGSGYSLTVPTVVIESQIYASLLTPTNNNRLMLNKLQLPEAGGVDEENVLLDVDPVCLVDVPEHVHP